MLYEVESLFRALIGLYIGGSTMIEKGCILENIDWFRMNIRMM